MQAGDAWVLARQHSAIDDHLWVVISDPALDKERVLIVSFTTLRSDKEQVCVVRQGEHPWVMHDTCVHYVKARQVTNAQLEQLRTSGGLSMWPSLSQALLARVRQGARASRKLMESYRQLLVDQGLIAPDLLPEPFRREVFRATIEEQDRGGDPAVARGVVAARMGVSDAEARAIEQEGIEQNWPPLDDEP